MTKKQNSSKISSSQSGLWKSKNSLLTNLDIELTERCPNNCIHCYINLPQNDASALKKEMSTGEVKRILAEAQELGCLQIRFTGGEPLLRKDFEDIYTFTRQLGMKVLLFTNAVLLTPRIAYLLSEIPPLVPVEISFYGLKQQSYEAVTQTAGSFRKARQGVERLEKMGIPFFIKTAVLPPNRHELEEFERWASGISKDREAPQLGLVFDLRGRRDSAEKNEAIQNLRLAPEEIDAVLNRNPEGYKKEIGRFLSVFAGSHGKNLFHCNAGKGSACVDAYGTLQLCLQLRHPDTVYDLKNGTLRDALKNFFPEVRKIKAENPDYLQRCAQCFLSDLCDQCPAKSWMENGSLDGPVDYLCDLIHSQARLLDLLRADEKAWEVKDWEKRIQTLWKGSDEKRSEISL